VVGYFIYAVKERWMKYSSGLLNSLSKFIDKRTTAFTKNVSVNCNLYFIFNARYFSNISSDTYSAVLTFLLKIARLFHVMLHEVMALYSVKWVP
jgi:hypothetical protein